TINAHNTSGDVVTGDGVYSATLYNRLYGNICGLAAQVKRKPHGAAGGWLIPDGTCGSLVVDNVSRHDMTGFSDFGTAQSEFEILPVELISFAAKAVENRFIRLDWHIDSDEDLSYFVVERSSDEGVSFQVLTEVQPSGNRYYFEDYEVVPNRNYYYRLRIVELPEVAKFSSIVVANLSANEAEGQLSKVKLYPNPTRDIFKVEFDVPQTRLRVFLYSSEGRLVRSLDISETTTNFDMNIGTLPSGLYLIKILNSNGILYEGKISRM
ncbi:MAG: T9SS type A sorting domain-containing protein, partial [Bernardetiaceae bacterium]|nr:T9SS type A sorting domain-containing protein [Bernardetiaceae bacterium]